MSLLVTLRRNSLEKPAKNKRHETYILMKFLFFSPKRQDWGSEGGWPFLYLEQVEPSVKVRKAFMFYFFGCYARPFARSTCSKHGQDASFVAFQSVDRFEAFTLHLRSDKP